MEKGLEGTLWLGEWKRLDGQGRALSQLVVDESYGIETQLGVRKL